MLYLFHSISFSGPKHIVQHTETKISKQPTSLPNDGVSLDKPMPASCNKRGCNHEKFQSLFPGGKKVSTYKNSYCTSETAIMTVPLLSVCILKKLEQLGIPRCNAYLQLCWFFQAEDHVLKAPASDKKLRHQVMLGSFWVFRCLIYVEKKSFDSYDMHLLRLS